MDSEALEVDFSEEEVWAAVCNCDGNKVSGLNGLNFNFIKAYWDVIQADFMRFINEFHSNGQVVKDLNKTFIALIPKCIHP